jgi:hypothetical protein
MGVLTRGAGMGDQPGADGEEAARDQLRRKRPRGGGGGGERVMEALRRQGDFGL